MASLHAHGVLMRRAFLAPTTYRPLVRRQLAEGGRPLAERGGSCEGTEPPSCAPCPPKPRPACRAPAAQAPCGLCVACYPAPPGLRPPCASPPPPCARTCAHARAQNERRDDPACACLTRDKCGDQLDIVARRLAAAERSRREDYEREVCARSELPAPAPAPYRLLDEHECLRATDGRDYRLARPVRLEPSDRCHTSRGRHVDPCGHHPRIFLEIDRTRYTKPSTTTDVPKPRTDGAADADSPPRDRSATVEGFAAKIMKSLRRNGDISCPRRRSSSVSAEATPAGDRSWCANMPPPVSVPPRCSPLRLSESLRSRPGCDRSVICGPRRGLHTKCGDVPLYTGADGGEAARKETDKGDLRSVLRQRSGLKEAGLGRTVVAENGPNDDRGLGAGALELKVPPSADTVRVRVLLDFDKPSPCARWPPAVSNSLDLGTLASSSTAGESNSWLSIKNLQKKFSGSRKNEITSKSKSGPCSGSQISKAPELKKESLSDETSLANRKDCATTPSPAALPKCPKLNQTQFSSIQNIFIPVYLS